MEEAISLPSISMYSLDDLFTDSQTQTAADLRRLGKYNWPEAPCTMTELRMRAVAN